MASSFRIRILDKRKDTLCLNLYIIHPEQHEFYEKKNFALQLIWQPAHPAHQKQFPINQEISMEDISDKMRKLAFVFVFFLYEPIFVGVFGGTIGHFIMNLRVRKNSDHAKKISIFSAVFRFAIKLLLGVISLISVNSDEKRRAIHDKLSGSVTIYAR